MIFICTEIKFNWRTVNWILVFYSLFDFFILSFIFQEGHFIEVVKVQSFQDCIVFLQQFVDLVSYLIFSWNFLVCFQSIIFRFLKGCIFSF